MFVSFQLYILKVNEMFLGSSHGSLCLCGTACAFQQSQALSLVSAGQAGASILICRSCSCRRVSSPSADENLGRALDFTNEAVVIVCDSVRSS